MLREHGGVEAARRLVEHDKPTSTFLKLIELGHPELTAESCRSPQGRYSTSRFRCPATDSAERLVLDPARSRRW
jgi:hypothetical protein